MDYMTGLRDNSVFLFKMLREIVTLSKVWLVDCISETVAATG